MQISSDILKNCWFLAGPTACGKSEAAVCLAERLGAEILAMDSMSLYRGMEIGTAKPSAALHHKVPHHLLDLCDLHETYNVAQYLEAAAAAAREVIGRGRIPLFVGGTGLYLRSLLRGVFDGPEIPADIRQALEAESCVTPTEELHRRLQDVDPQAAGRIHANDARRIIRALEVFAATGQPLSELQRQTPISAANRPSNVFWLAPPRVWLYSRIDERVRRMFADGLLDEVRALLAAPLPLSFTARQALGYKEVIDHLEQGTPFADVVEQIQRRTRQFAKRQHTWFRNLEECRAIEISGQESASGLADTILSAAQRSSVRP